MVGAISEAGFGYQDRRRQIDEVLDVEARSAANRIQTFIDGIRGQLGWTVQLAWTEADDERRRVDALRLLRQVPAISSIALVDHTGHERVFVSRLGLNRIGRGPDLSAAPAVLGARARKAWYGPLRYERDSEPYMTIAVSGNRAATGVAIAEINLKLIWDVIAAIKIGDTGLAFVFDDDGRLIAHPDISLVLRGAVGSSDFDQVKSAVAAAPGAAVMTKDAAGKDVVAASARIASLNWTVIAQQPVSEALASIRAALWRSSVLIAVMASFAIALAYWLAYRMSKPIRQLEDGVQKLGAGQFGHRITISSGDELEQLADRVNEMAKELAISKDKSERINLLKRFLAPQVAELVERSGRERLLSGQRRDVVAIFGDLRGFTAFASRSEPHVIMPVVKEYYRALGAVITRHEATLASFTGDGVMVLVNAPVARADPALHGIRLAIDMQAALQPLVARWSAKGYTIGFGVGIAMGPAIVGTVGYEGRMDYTAIGSVVNLASRLCDLAKDTQVLTDPVIAREVKDAVPLVPLGEHPIKGYDRPSQVFMVAPCSERSPEITFRAQKLTEKAEWREHKATGLEPIAPLAAPCRAAPADVSA
ncbi:cache domain-containing protein [Bradyrhizobium sp. LHD-71]|nr:cache domain-containing protein [Bradyrhizobium sp. LHD-71]MDQ8732318.1 cache domain-containing protein [Bradyrhizobium sp. LHD-71]